ncbi:hypothetical protein [Actinoplanes sp. NBRC 101535]|uniref:hypothetical protein n=1 Tax=Actinoplanes sp. NBRC 101535 TaxID=3032196 RepID=UPI0024A3E1E2|nr:hypothetical protein [Actinoplanes sp. NBRC 101535]GLY08315.1 hypothetical protein Acsp01_86940 [Actinoplanes sp. NBRC 101535]
MAATATADPRPPGPSSPPLRQPPAKFAALLNRPDDLYRALTTDDEQWDSARFAAESGRSTGRFRVWVSDYYKWREAADRARRRGRTPPVPHDRAIVAPDGYFGRAPWWYAGRARQWMMRVGLMDRQGRSVRHKPVGRRKGVGDVAPRRRRRPPMQDQAVEILGQVEALIAQGASLEEAKAQVARDRALSVRQVARRVTAGRKLRDEDDPWDLTGLGGTALAAQVTALANTLMADGRRKNMSGAASTIAERTGLEVAEVERLLGAMP